MAWLSKIGGWLSGRPAAAGSEETALSSDIADEFKELIQNLVTLEINTIVKENMTAQAMPTMANAMIEIARTYLRGIDTFQVDVDELIAATSTPPAATDVNRWEVANLKKPPGAKRAIHLLDERQPTTATLSLYDLFQFVRWSAAKTLLLLDDDLTDVQRSLLIRMRQNADRICGILRARKRDGAPAMVAKVRDVLTGDDVKVREPDFSPREILVIKKIWDVGVEHVVAQTVIQLDGDVITRITPDLDRVAGSHVDADRLLALHNQGLATALDRWTALVEVAESLVRGLLGFRQTRP